MNILLPIGHKLNSFTMRGGHFMYELGNNEIKDETLNSCSATITPVVGDLIPYFKL